MINKIAKYKIARITIQSSEMKITRKYRIGTIASTRPSQKSWRTIPVHVSLTTGISNLNVIRIIQIYITTAQLS